jgi:hypothetical protein
MFLIPDLGHGRVSKAPKQNLSKVVEVVGLLAGLHVCIQTQTQLGLAPLIHVAKHGHLQHFRLAWHGLGQAAGPRPPQPPS